MDSLTQASLDVEAPQEATLIADVIVPRPVAKPLSYSVPATFAPRLRFGSVVRVPFRSGDSEGFVVGLRDAGAEAPAYKLKAVKDVLIEAAVFNEMDWKLFRWIADYYQAPLGEVFFSAFPKAFLKVTEARKKAPPPMAPPEPPPRLTADQSTALDRIKAALDARAFRSFLLYGVTGSGKTEVYMRAAAETLAAGRGTVVLVPEIALTPQLRTRFESRFGDQVAVLHSSLTEATRRGFWKDILAGKRRIVVGARSAIFAPLQDIGLIVVDEEHEPSYKQEGHLRYHARDVALVRARDHGAACVLGSATPSIETFYAAEHGKHELLELKTRPSDRPMPEIELVDLTSADGSRPPQKSLIGDRLLESLTETLARGEQAMVFLNRKGFSNFLLCTDCGHVPGCDRCSVTLTYYRSSGTLRCHYCGQQNRAPDACGECNGRDFKFMGFGTETIEQELRDLLPGAHIGRLDADTADSPKRLEEILAKFRSGETGVLVGTQMLAKGHDFPNVTLIGVVMADMGMHLPDFRACERTFQLLSQVSGRAGRGDKPGKVIMQTYSPESPAIQCALTHDFRAFYAQEIEARRVFAYPPFARMAQIEFRHANESLAHRDAERMAQMARELSAGEGGGAVEVLGPAPASVAKVAGDYRWHMLLKAEKISALNAVLKTLRREGARLIDVDPVNAL